LHGLGFPGWPRGCWPTQKRPPLPTQKSRRSAAKRLELEQAVFTGNLAPGRAVVPITPLRRPVKEKAARIKSRGRYDSIAPSFLEDNLHPNEARPSTVLRHMVIDRCASLTFPPPKLSGAVRAAIFLGVAQCQPRRAHRTAARLAEPSAAEKVSAQLGPKLLAAGAPSRAKPPAARARWPAASRDLPVSASRSPSLRLPMRPTLSGPSRK
jgi:hypothetical protein